MRFLLVLVTLLPLHLRAEDPPARCFGVFSRPRSLHFVTREHFVRDFDQRIADPDLRTSFDLVEATSSFQNARVIFIGERHDQNHRQMLRKLIQSLATSPEDLLLTERDPNLPSNEVFLSALSLPLRETGWDSQIYNQLGRHYYEQILASEKKISKALADRALPLAREEELMEDFYWSHLNFHHFAIQIRDQILIENVLKHTATLSSEGKIFVIAGSHHIDDNWGQIYTALQRLRIPYVAIKSRPDPDEPDSFDILREQALDHLDLTEMQVTEILNARSRRILQEITPR